MGVTKREWCRCEQPLVLQDAGWDWEGNFFVTTRCFTCGKQPVERTEVTDETEKTALEEKVDKLEAIIVGLAERQRQRDPEAARRQQGEALLKTLNEQTSGWANAGSLTPDEKGEDQ